jgi:superfamily I DNA/RNA helicase
MPRWSGGLSGPHLDIASSDDSFLLVLAGPGTGKTFALMRKVARLLEEGENPGGILVVTFTRTAAADLRTQLEELGVHGVDIVTASTLHSLCFRILRKRDILERAGRVARTLFPYEMDYLLRDLGGEFGGIRDRRKLLVAYTEASAKLQREGLQSRAPSLERRFANQLEEWLRFHRAMLVEELVPLALAYLRAHPTSPERTMFSHILVDEYQDLNRADQMAIDVLADAATLTVAGDDNQSIYGFRNAHPEGITEFPQRHAGTRQVRLKECRRCPARVVKVANALIEAGGASPDRRLRVASASPPGEVRLLRWQDPDGETKGISKIAAAYLRSNSPVSPGDILVLVPRKTLGSRLKVEMSGNFIPAETVFAEDILRDKEARLRITLLQLLVDPNDRAALRHWLGSSSSSGFVKSYSKLRAVCESETAEPTSVLDDVVGGGRRIPYAGRLAKRYRELRDEMNRLSVLHGTEFIDAWLPPDVESLESLRDMVVNQIGPDASREQMLQDLKTLLTQPEVPTRASYVRIMTMHKAKGLGAHTVIVVGLVDGLIPNVPDDLVCAERNRAVAEQRRLLYVAVTRAKQRLILSYWTRATHRDALRMRARVAEWAGRGVVRVRSSRFLRDLGTPTLSPVAGERYLESL